MTQEGALSESRTFPDRARGRESSPSAIVSSSWRTPASSNRALTVLVRNTSRTVCSRTVVPPAIKRGDPLLSVRLDNGRNIVFSEGSYRNVDHGYAATIHKSQGSTVDRTFVLATGMMDQHLTYVSMTRHRDRVDLYAAKEDFETRPEWGRKPRADHAAGVSGELVETGEAKFRPE
jgi:hypothetical protein